MKVPSTTNITARIPVIDMLAEFKYKVSLVLVCNLFVLSVPASTNYSNLKDQAVQASNPLMPTRKRFQLRFHSSLGANGDSSIGPLYNASKNAETVETSKTIAIILIRLSRTLYFPIS